ncbi:MAG: AAA family ATPase [Marinobacter sp.]|nr:AAA family ATPase [Marinobacter sp.]
MYYDFFGFREPPFSIAPDPRYLYLSERHKEALAHLMYGVQGQGGFIVITGEVGTGKTTVSRCFIENVPDHVDIALILNPRLSARELLSSVCDELEISHPLGASIKQLVDLINADLLKAHAAGRHKVLVIDEAQNLSADVLEQLRLLTNLETAEKKLLQIVLLGQPELQALLARPELRQLNQRVTARYHLDALAADELPGYLRYRLGVAGLRADIFTAGAIKTLFRVSDGIPRLVNLISDRALLGAYAEGEHVITRGHIRTAAHEVKGGMSAAVASRNGRNKRHWLMISASVLLALVATVLLLDRWDTDAVSPSPQASEAVQPLEGAIERLEDEDEAAIENESESESESEIGNQNQNQEEGRTQADLPTLPEFDFARQTSSRTGAYRLLFSIWGLDYSPSENPAECLFAVANNLRCLDRQGTWGSLSFLDRPAILELRNMEENMGEDSRAGATGETGYAALRSINGKEAVLLTTDGLQTVSAGSLERYWSGKFTVLWQLPSYMLGERDETPAARAGMAARMMELAELYSPDPAENDRINRMDLDEQVRWFQSKKGLAVDGIAGPMTLIQINNDLDADLPRLSDGASGGGN